jgi:hypothetical protein
MMRLVNTDALGRRFRLGPGILAASRFLLPTGAVWPRRSVHRPITGVQLRIARGFPAAVVERSLARQADALVANHWRHMITGVMYYATARRHQPISVAEQEDYGDLARRLLGVDFAEHGQVCGLVIVAYVEQRMYVRQYDALAAALRSRVYPAVDIDMADNFLDKIIVDVDAPPTGP